MAELQEIFNDVRWNASTRLQKARRALDRQEWQQRATLLVSYPARQALALASEVGLLFRRVHAKQHRSDG